MLLNVVECCGMLWDVVECCGMLWSVVECCGVLWSVLRVFMNVCEKLAGKISNECS